MGSTMGNQFKRNIEDGMAWISMTEVAMTDMNELIQSIRERAVQGASDTIIARERAYIATDVTQLMKQFVSLANSQFKGNYLFGGTNGDKRIYEYEQDTTYTFQANPAGTIQPAGRSQKAIMLDIMIIQDLDTIFLVTTMHQLNGKKDGGGHGDMIQEKTTRHPAELH